MKGKRDMPLSEIIAVCGLPAGVGLCASALFTSLRGVRTIHRLVMASGVATMAAGLFTIGRDLHGLTDGIAVSTSVTLAGFAVLLLTDAIADAWKQSETSHADKNGGKGS
jgi:hypothetical protein